MKWCLIGALIFLQVACAFTPHQIIAHHEIIVDCSPKDKNMRFINADTVDVTHTIITHS